MYEFKLSNNYASDTETAIEEIASLYFTSG